MNFNWLYNTLLLLVISILVTFQTSINLTPNLKHLLYSEVNIWLKLENSLHNNVEDAYEKCTLLIVDNKLDRIDGEFYELPALRINLHNSSDNRNLKFQYVQHFSTSCTIAYYVLPNANWLGLLNPGFIYLLPGGVFKSFHVLLFQDGAIALENLESKLKSHPLVQQYVGADAGFDKELRNIKLMHHFVIITSVNSTLSPTNITADKYLRISTFNFWFNSSQVLLDLLESRTNNSSVADGSNKLILFPSKWLDFNGAKVPVVTTPDTYQGRLEEFIQNKIVKTGGYTTATMFYTLQYFNATPIFNSKPSVHFGQENPATHKWDGIIGEILNGHVLFSSAIGQSYDRNKVLIFGHPYHFDKVTFLTPLPQIASEPGSSLEFLTKPIQATVWYAFIISFILIVVVILFKKYFIDNNHCTKFGTIIFDLLIRPIFDQSNHENLKQRNLLTDNLSRTLISIWLLSLIALITAYRSSFISILLAPTIIYPPKTFLELVESNYRIGSVLYNESFMSASFNGLHNRIGMEIRSRVKGYPLVKPDCFLNIANAGNRDVCLGVASYQELYGTRYLTDKNGKKLYKTSEDSLFPISAGCAVPKDFPHLIENLNKVLDRFFDSGFVEQTFKLEKIYNAKVGQQFSKQQQRLLMNLEINDESNGNEGSIKGVHRFMIMLLFVGFGIALIILCLEFIVFYCWERIISVVNCNTVYSIVIKQ